MNTLPQTILFKLISGSTLKIFPSKYSGYTMHYRAGGNGPAVPVLPGPVFLKVKMKFHFSK